MKKILVLTAMSLLFSLAALANIPDPNWKPTPKPKLAKPIDTSLTIRLDRDAKEARLVIPKGQIKKLRAELEQMDAEQDNTAAVTGDASRTQTIMSGIFLSLAFVFGGVLFVRSGKAATKTGKTLVIVAFMAGVGSIATFVYANAGPPAEARSITGKMFSQSVHLYKFGSGSIKLETKADGEGVDLIVPDPAPEKVKAED